MILREIKILNKYGGGTPYHPHGGYPFTLLGGCGGQVPPQVGGPSPPTSRVPHPPIVVAHTGGRVGTHPPNSSKTSTNRGVAYPP